MEMTEAVVYFIPSSYTHYYH